MNNKYLVFLPDEILSVHSLDWENYPSDVFVMNWNGAWFRKTEVYTHPWACVISQSVPPEIRAKALLLT